MIELDYGVQHFDKLIWSAIDRRETVVLTVTGWRSRLIANGMAFHKEYVESIKSGKRQWLLLFKFALCAFPTVSFWGLVNHASMAAMTPQLEWVDGNTLKVTFTSGAG